MNALFLLMLAAYGFGIVGTLLLGGSRWGRVVTAVGAGGGAATGLAIGVTRLVTHRSFRIDSSLLTPLTGFSLQCDGLSAFFLIVIGLVGMAVALYGFGYTASYAGRYSLRLVGVMLNVLLLSLSLQVLAANALTFLLMWELMSLSAYWLVLTEADQPGTVQAGGWYIAMTHLGFAALVAMFLLLTGGELTTSFAAMQTTAAGLTPLVRNLIFLLALFGFGTKAGIIPLHVWLPLAHPVAPSHVSALMSGVVIKMGIYGLVRVVLDLLGGGPAWWGGTILAIGALSAIIGILYALMQNDLKRLLAYSSVENIGIILMGVGVGLLFHSYGLMTLAALGLIGGLYHTLNHACFKGLLFLGAGSVLHATHTRNMEALGGLIKPMPWTALFFLIGAAAIAALPPLNGFVSEWLIFQALLGGFNIPAPKVAVLMPLAVGMLALTSGLAAAGFVKAFGITFLAIPRSPAAQHADEAPLSMRAGMAILVLACLGLGLAPALIVPLLGGVLTGLGGLPDTQASLARNITTGSTVVQLPVSQALDALPFGQTAPLLVGIGLLGILVLIPLVMWALRVNRTLRVGDSWGCGRIGQTPRMEYTATAFAEPLRRVFAELYRPTKELTIDFHPESKYFVQSIAYKSEIRPWFEEFIYTPVVRAIQWISHYVRRLQSGSLHGYVAYLFGMLVLILGVLLWSGA